jgi:hypothetical protein
VGSPLLSEGLPVATEVVLTDLKLALHTPVRREPLLSGGGRPEIATILVRAAPDG